MVEGSTSSEVDMITKANSAAERLEKANELNKELVRRMEALEARRVLGGKSEAGEPPKAVEESPVEYAKRILRGGK